MSGARYICGCLVESHPDGDAVTTCLEHQKMPRRCYAVDEYSFINKRLSEIEQEKRGHT